MRSSVAALPRKTDDHLGALGIPESSPPAILGEIPRDRGDTVFRRLLAVADLAAALMGLMLVGVLIGRDVPPITLLVVPLIVPLAKVAGRYDRDEVVLRKSTLDEVPALTTLAAAFALTWDAIAFGAGVHLGGVGVVLLWACTSVCLITARSGMRAVARVSAPPERALIVGAPDTRAKLTDALQCEPGARVEIVGYLPLEDELGMHRDGNGRHGTANGNGAGDADDGRRRRALPPEELASAVRASAIDRVFLIPSGEHTEEVLDLVRWVTGTGVKVSIVPRLFEVVGSTVEFDAVGGLTVLGVRRPGLTRSSQLVKRSMDIVGSTLGLVVLAPLGFLVAVAIKLDTPGPVFFRQARVGRGGRRFQMLKFRSMVQGADRNRQMLEPLNESRGLFKLSNDPRVTRVGRWLRSTSLDELPQLINVLRGEMSLVGPRPLVIDEDALVEGWHRERLQLVPGMTGPWQVLGPKRPPLAEMVKVDYLYVANWSLWNDVKILLRTSGHVIARRGM